MKVLKMVWAAPWSLVGLLLCPFFKSRRIVHGVLLCEGASWPARVGWRFVAITFGHVVLSTQPASEKLLNHELVHVRQYERWGPFFIPAYAVSSAIAAAKGGHHYRDNRFEVAARSHGAATKDEPGSI